MNNDKNGGKSHFSGLGKKLMGLFVTDVSDADQQAEQGVPTQSAIPSSAPSGEAVSLKPEIDTKMLEEIRNAVNKSSPLLVNFLAAVGKLTKDGGLQEKQAYIAIDVSRDDINVDSLLAEVAKTKGAIEQESEEFSAFLAEQMAEVERKKASVADIDQRIEDLKAQIESLTTERNQLSSEAQDDKTRAEMSKVMFGAAAETVLGEITAIENKVKTYLGKEVQ